MNLLYPAALPADRARFAHYRSVLGPGEGPLDETRFRRELQTLVRGDEKLLVEGGPHGGARVFDLAADPAELAGEPAPEAGLLEEIAAWARSLEAPPASDKDGLDPRAAAEQEARLGAIGYGGGDD